MNVFLVCGCVPTGVVVPAELVPAPVDSHTYARGRGILLAHCHDPVKAVVHVAEAVAVVMPTSPGQMFAPLGMVRTDSSTAKGYTGDSCGGRTGGLDKSKVAVLLCLDRITARAG